MGSVSVEKKREFIKWVLDCLSPKGSRGGFSLLYTFGKYERFISRLHFVENAMKYPYGVEISAKESSRPWLACYKPNVTVDDMDAIYNHFSTNDNPIYIQMNFKMKYKHPLYMAVLEDDESSIETDI